MWVEFVHLGAKHIFRTQQWARGDKAKPREGLPQLSPIWITFAIIFASYII